MYSCILRLARIPGAYLLTDSVDVFEPSERVADCPRREPCFLNKSFLCEGPFMLKNHETPYYLGMRAALAVSYARIHWQNLVNFGIVPLEFVDRDDYEAIDQGDTLELPAVREEMQDGSEVTVRNVTQDTTFAAEHSLNPRQVEIVLQGGLIKDYKNWNRDRCQSSWTKCDSPDRHIPCTEGIPSGHPVRKWVCFNSVPRGVRNSRC